MSRANPEDAAIMQSPTPFASARAVAYDLVAFVAFAAGIAFATAIVLVAAVLLLA